VPTLSATQARDNLPETLNQVAYGGERIVIKRRGKVLAAIIPASDLALLEALEDRYLGEMADETLAKMRAKRQKPIPWKKVERTCSGPTPARTTSSCTK
jgi:prevent-host-death family protein